MAAAILAALPLSACSSEEAEPLPVQGRHDGIDTQTGRLTTRHWPGQHPRWIVMRPAKHRHAQVVISLHGKGGDAASTFTDLRPQRYILQTGLAVAAIDGGDYYWHARRSESTGYNGISTDTPPCDTGAMVRDDFLPLLTRLGLDTSRIGLLGWSMGGYGVLLLASVMGPAKVAAVAPLSAALWTDPGLTAPGAFDDREDWEQHNVFARRTELGRIPIRLVCGTSDPFYAADKAFVDGFPAAERSDVISKFSPGAHDPSYWSAQTPGQMHFLATHVHSH